MIRIGFSRKNVALGCIGGGISFYLGYKCLYNYNDDNNHKVASLYRSVPWRFISVVWGHINRDYEIPVFLRKPLYTSFSNAFGCNLDECELPLEKYVNLDSFFTRKLKENIRPISFDSLLISPVDGKIQSVGTLEKGNTLVKVKGMEFDFTELIEYKPQPREGHQIYHVVFYLGPGDYHRFHSPTDFIPNSIARISGEKYSVSPRIVEMIPNLFCLNERVVLNGEWRYGNFSYVAVGATNVGSIEIKETLSLMPKGDEVGIFHFGSTVILIFEAPRDLKFSVKIGDDVKMGQSITFS